MKWNSLKISYFSIFSSVVDTEKCDYLYFSFPTDMNVLWREVLAVFLVILNFSECIRVLGVFPTSYRSHWIIGSSILKQLSLAGHDVTLVSPFDIKVENVREVVLNNKPEGDNLILKHHKIKLM